MNEHNNLLQVKNSVYKVRMNLSKGKNFQWWLGMKVFERYLMFDF